MPSQDDGREKMPLSLSVCRQAKPPPTLLRGWTRRRHIQQPHCQCGLQFCAANVGGQTCADAAAGDAIERNGSRQALNFRQHACNSSRKGGLLAPFNLGGRRTPNSSKRRHSAPRSPPGAQPRQQHTCSNSRTGDSMFGVNPSTLHVDDRRRQRAACSISNSTPALTGTGGSLFVNYVCATHKSGWRVGQRRVASSDTKGAARRFRLWQDACSSSKTACACSAAPFPLTNISGVNALTFGLSSIVQLQSTPMARPAVVLNLPAQQQSNCGVVLCIRL